MVGKLCANNTDLDNLEKALYDSLNGVVWIDDRQIVHHDNKKRWAQGQGYIEILIEVLTPEYAI